MGNSCSSSTKPRSNKLKEPAEPKEFSWDKRKKGRERSLYAVSKKQRETIIRAPGALSGEQFCVEECVDCRIYALDHTTNVTVDKCSRCIVFIGPCESSIFVRDCVDCKFFIACQQFRARDLTRCKVWMFCSTEPVLEVSPGLQIGCLAVGYPELPEHLSKAGLSPWNNRWSEVHNFTPEHRWVAAPAEASGVGSQLGRDAQLRALLAPLSLPEEEDEEEGGEAGAKKKKKSKEEEERERIENEKKEAKLKEKRDKMEEDKVVRTARQLAVSKAKEEYFMMLACTTLKEHPSQVLKHCFEETQNQVVADNAEAELDGPIGYGLCKIEPDGPFRQTVLKPIVGRPSFENLILVCIILSCIMLAYEGTGFKKGDPAQVYFYYGDLFLLAVFVIECVLRILYKGFLFTNVAYLRDPWNQLDFFIVVSDVAATFFSAILEQYLGMNLNLRGLRGLRALRPLRALKRAPELMTVVDLIAKCLPLFLNIAFILFGFYLTCGIFMMTLFAGRFWQCNDPSVLSAEACGGYFSALELKAYRKSLDGMGGAEHEGAFLNSAFLWGKQWPVAAWAEDGTPLVARQWYNSPRNFDTVGQAMLTMFELSTLDHWVEVLFLAVDSPDKPGEGPAAGNRTALGASLVIGIVILGNYLFLNLFVAGVCTVYDQLKPDSKFNPELTRGQRELLDALRLMLRTRPGYQQLEPRPKESSAAQLLCWKIVMFDLSGDGRGKTFELLISFLVMFQTALLALYYFEGPEPGSGEYILTSESEAISELQQTVWATNLSLISDGLSAVFFCEMLIKLMAFGFADYWKDNWNRFDFLVVWSGVFNSVVDGFMGFTLVSSASVKQAQESLGFDPRTLRILRVARLVRVLRLLKGLNRYERIQAITQLVDTLQNCVLGALNVFGLWLVVTCTFALLALTLFGDVPFDGDYGYGAYGPYTNFSNFGQAMAALFKIATLDNWTWLMRDMMQAQRQVGETPSAWIFFLTYIFITAFLFLNIFTATVMEQYAFTARVTSKPRNGVSKQILTFGEATKIAEEWAYLDPRRSGFVDELALRELLFRIGPPVGFKPDANRAMRLRHLRRMELRMTNTSREVHYVDFFLSCVVLRYRAQRKPVADLNLGAVRGKLVLSIGGAFPSINDPRIEDSMGCVVAVQAMEHMQAQYRAKILRRAFRAKDYEKILNATLVREAQITRRLEMEKREQEDALKASKKGKADAKGGKKKKKKY
mmetsp:Transcript_59808/g.135318  ORF Transcript_59808/g.135318 Transcript_59808/m.135318 type:complete len:1220 (-) Transcript_59808:205-3864(-)